MPRTKTTLASGTAKSAAIDWPAALRSGPVGVRRGNKATKNHVSDTLLRYKGVEAGEVGWRPTETIPEDFYSI